MKKIKINRLNDYLKKTYGTKVYKLPLDGGFSCPNRVNSKGCIFCSESGSGEFTFNEYSIKEQVELQIKRLSEKKKADKFIAYFQSFTNTYKPVNELREIYSDAIDNENVLVLDIATRGDCLDDEKIKLLRDIN
ncbi:MAG: TIGR01212 family radical SAM protein, partial [Finegoldia magna]|nr:TIGR01212 family radical SAM protein [Finegoldia magna]